MIILGIDPGTALTGYAILETKEKAKPLLVASSVVKTSKDLEMPVRLRVLYKGLKGVVKEYSPDIMVVERLFFNTNAKTAISVGQARGVTLLAAADKKIPVFEHTALEAKMVLTGYGRSDKKAVQEAVRDFFELEDIIKPDDASDAVAMALCFLSKQEEFSGFFDFGGGRKGK